MHATQVGRIFEPRHTYRNIHTYIYIRINAWDRKKCHAENFLRFPIVLHRRGKKTRENFHLSLDRKSDKEELESRGSIRAISIDRGRIFPRRKDVNAPSRPLNLSRRGGAGDALRQKRQFVSLYPAETHASTAKFPDGRTTGRPAAQLVRERQMRRYV